MSDPAAQAPHGEGHHTNYVKIWGILVVLLVISVLGPFLGHPVVTLFTAFGIALVKAYLVGKHFMHLSLERKWIGYLVFTMLALMLVMVGGVAPDVLKHDGLGWENRAAKQSVEQGNAAGEAAEKAGHGAPGAAPAGEHH
ncbi:MAG: cytochrome C oxidase subunit IV family protein [Myxococcales bacterium]|nr:cytochrome C oxidase subunit IV family protein [Myxococcales bacterium]